MRPGGQHRRRRRRRLARARPHRLHLRLDRRRPWRTACSAASRLIREGRYQPTSPSGPARREPADERGAHALPPARRAVSAGAACGRLGAARAGPRRRRRLSASPACCSSRAPCRRSSSAIGRWRWRSRATPCIWASSACAAWSPPRPPVPGRRLPELLAPLPRACAWRLTAMALAVVTRRLRRCWRPHDLPLVGLVTLSIVPIALQLDWLALVDDRAGLAAVPAAGAAAGVPGAARSCGAAGSTRPASPPASSRPGPWRPCRPGRRCAVRRRTSGHRADAGTHAAPGRAPGDRHRHQPGCSSVPTCSSSAGRSARPRAGDY